MIYIMPQYEWKLINQQISWFVSEEGTWRVIESMVSTGNSRVCRITVGGSREKERTYYVWDTGGEARSSGEKTPGYYQASMQNSGVHITILYVTRKWIPFTAYVSPISSENRKGVLVTKQRSTFDYSYQITRRVTKANLIEFRDTTEGGGGEGIYAYLIWHVHVTKIHQIQSIECFIGNRILLIIDLAPTIIFKLLEESFLFQIKLLNDNGR